MGYRSIRFNLTFAIAAATALLVLFIGSEVSAATITIGDPAGDTFMPPGPNFDILTVTVTDVDTDAILGNDAITLLITFNPLQPISAPSDGGGDAVFGFILIDTNKDADMAAALNDVRVFGSPPVPALNIEFYVDLGSEKLPPTGPGFVDLLASDAATDLADLPISYTSSSITITAPYSAFVPALVGPNAVLDFNFGAIVGNADNATDQAPDLVNVIPEPASLTLFGLGLACFTGVSRRRRRK